MSDNEPFETPQPQPQPQPAPPPFLYAPPAYQPPPKPKRGPIRTFFRIILLLIGIVVFLFIALIVLGVVAALMDSGNFSIGEKIGVVRIDGVIMQGQNSQFWIKEINDLAANERVKGIIVRIESPGGTVGASQELYSAVRNCRDSHKKVWVSMGDVAASGGYYIASAGERIFANKGTLTGSIGVIFSKADISGLSQKIGYATEVVKSGKFKDSGDPMRKLTPEEQAMFQGLINNTYGQFIDDVYAMRRPALEAALKKFPDSGWERYGFKRPQEATSQTLPREFLKQVADGRVYTGEQALELGLVDQIGGLEETAEKFGKALGIKGKPSLLEHKQRRGLFGRLEARMEDVLPQSYSPLSYRMDPAW
ncbi:signal peptide peptidase SppA [bacterium]|nr:signal peptide peptidase SppA [bacterium]